MIDARQDNGYKLNELDLELSLLRVDPNRHQDPQQSQEQTNRTLLILEPPSPRYLKGKNLTVHASRQYTIEPQVEALGVNISVGTITGSRDQYLERTWHFQSHWSNDPVSGQYTTASWQWTATADNTEFEDVGALYAGLVLQHSNQPFYISCKASGKLAKRRHRFRARRDDERPYSTRLTPQASTEQIEQHARDLDSVLYDLNLHAAPSK
jgi:hypothetical protein